jgi:hypothetical protein
MVFQKNARQAWLPLGDVIRDTLKKELFGAAVALSEDGTTIAVGAVFGGQDYTSFGVIG